MTRKIATVVQAAEILGLTKTAMQNYINRKKSFIPKPLPEKGAKNCLFFYEDEIKEILKNEDFIRIMKNKPEPSATFNQMAFAFLWNNCEHKQKCGTRIKSAKITS